MELWGREDNFTGRCILSRRVKGISPGNIHGPRAHQTWKIKMGNLAFTRHSDGVVVTLVDSTEMVVGLLRSSLSENAFHAILGRASVATGNGSERWMKRLYLSV